MASKEFEVIVHRTTNLKLVFDLPTPRPHFIIKRIRNNNDSNQLMNFLEAENQKEIQEVFELCIGFLNSNTQFKNSDSIFSLHTGYFCTMNEFHAHLSVNLEDYIEYFKSKCPDTCDFKPTKQWEIKTGNIKEAYIENLKRYKAKEISKYNGWKIDDLKEINKLIFNSNANELNKIKDVTVAMHPSLPKIGFKPISTNQNEIGTYFQILQVMKNFADRRGYFKRNGGSHLCLYLVNKSNFNVTGYVLTTGLEFYQLFDNVTAANAWKDKFEKEKNFFVET